MGLKSERYLGYFFIAPMMLFLFGIVLFPLFHAFSTSLYVEQGTKISFVGFQNYLQLLENDQFINSLQVTLKFSFLAVFLHLVIAMPLALFLNQIQRGRKILRLLFLMPWMVAAAISGMIWRWMFDAHFGVLNHVLRLLGIIDSNVVWLGTTESAFGSIVAIEAWRGFPFVMLIILAGLQTIPVELFEAAAIDGASPFQKFRFITMPHLRYLLVVATTLDIINTVRTFDLINVTTRGGPARGTEVLPVLIYNTAFVNVGQVGKAAAIGVFLLLILLVFSAIYIRILQPNKSEDDRL